MRALEFIVEAVSRADSIDHLRKRARQVVQLLEPIADHPLVYREFRHNIGAETAVLKVSNTDRTEFKARSGSNPKQPELLRALGIENPVFCTMSTPSTTQGFFGGANIFVPGAGYRVVWSPVVRDLGGNDVVGPDADRYGHRDLGRGVSQGPTPDRQVGAEFADTYKSGWPSEYTSNELIFDCESYYLLNIRDFLRRFAGRQNRAIVNPRARYADINQEVFNAKFSTYGDIVWYLSNTLPKYLDWYEANVVAESSLTERAERARDAIENIVSMGNIDDYFVRSTDIDKIGYSAHQDFGRTPDIGDPDYDPNALPKKKGRPALWFYPARYYLQHKDLFAGGRPYIWLVKQRPNAYLQPTQGATQPEAPEGMIRAGLMHNESGVPVAVFFRPEFDVVDRWHEPKRIKENFADKKVKGKSRPGRVKRAGASCSGSVTSLRAKAKKSGGERGKMFHWCANMKGGKKK